MERLTHWCGQENHAVPTEFDIGPIASIEDDDIWMGFDALVTRLAAYEDTGLTPEDLPRAAELLKAEKEGRCVVLDGPRKPLIWDDDHEAIRCAYCGTDLMGIPYGERMALQCPDCGEYIDATKTITRAEAEAALGGGGDD